MSAAAGPVLELADITFRRDGRAILDGVSLTIRPGEDWVVIGPNGCGKTTLGRIASLWEHPSSGSATVLGERLGHTDVRRLRQRLAFVSSAMADLFRPDLSAEQVVVCARHAALEPWWHTYTDADHHRARTMLDRQGVGRFADRPFGSLSSGERQRVMLARALMNAPELVVLDEPNAGLDLAGREQLVDRLDVLARDPDAPPVVLVTHHVEEIPPGFTHLLAMRDGRVVRHGPIAQVLTSELLEECFGVDVILDRHDGPAGLRYSARRR